MTPPITPLARIQEQMRETRAELANAEQDYAIKQKKAQHISTTAHRAYLLVEELKLELRRLDAAAVQLNRPLSSFEDKKEMGSDR